jgi:RNA polymerase sigma-70 factor (ECF subfamily)
VVQSICREVLQGLGGLRQRDDASFRSWLYVAAARKIQHRLEHWRAQKRDAGREVPLAAGTPGDSCSGLGPELLGCYRSFCTPSEDLASREEIERIEAAFDRLPEDQRRVIALVKVAGLPHAEAARELGRSESATRMLLYRALAQLAELLHEPPERAARE